MSPLVHSSKFCKYNIFLLQGERAFSYSVQNSGFLQGEIVSTGEIRFRFSCLVIWNSTA